MKIRWRVGVVLAALIADGAIYFLWQENAPRRQSLATLEGLQQGLASANSASILDTISLPAAIKDRTAPEQTEFLAKALRGFPKIKEADGLSLL